jgi:P4 family phage/plasmid primase-like protien
MGISISNQAFLNEVFGHQSAALCAWVTSFKTKPSDAKKEWGGQCIPIHSCPNYVDSNAYFSVSLFAQDEPARRKNTMKEMHVVVLDDAQNISIDPSWRLETSENNYQIGFILNQPITDAELGTRLLKEISRQSFVNKNDRNGNNPVRYVRLPNAVNTKVNPPFRHSLVQFNPERRYTLEEIIEALTLDGNFILHGLQRINNSQSGLTGITEFERLGSGINLENQKQIIRSGEHFHDQMLKITAKLVSEGKSPELVRKECEQFMLSIPIDQRRANWQNDFNDIPHMINGAIEKGFHIQTVGNVEVDLITGEVKQRTQSERYGDIYNGKVFAQMYKDKLIYVHSRKRWLTWNGTVWEWCMAKEEDVAAKKATKEIARLAGEAFANNPQDPDRTHILGNARQVLNNTKRNEMVMASISESGMSLSGMDSLDADGMLLGCSNGVINLQTGTLLESDPKMFITRQAKASFNHDAKAPLWEKFMLETFKGDAETVRYMQAAFGYGITGVIKQEVIHFCYGGGQNGKSVMANVLVRILSDYTVTANARMLMRKEGASSSDASPEIARLQGARFVFANEVEERQVINEQVIKMLAGREKIEARYLYSEPFEFWPTFKVFVRANHKPTITDLTDSIWRRVRLVPFENTIPDDLVDQNLEEKLMAERDGILTWLVEGCLIWQKEGLVQSTKILECTKSYRLESDKVGTFVDECCEVTEGSKETRDTIYECWRNWCADAGIHPLSRNKFTRRLKEVYSVDPDGYMGKARAYIGIALKPDVRAHHLGFPFVSETQG